MSTLTSTAIPFSTRANNLPSSFIRDILKVADNKEVISFAGGLPDSALFPTSALERSTAEVFKLHGSHLLQYGKSEGLDSLKTWICEYYHTQYRLKVSPEQLLITNGSQQALDLIGKAFIDAGTPVILEQPSYLGAIQAFMAYEPSILPLPSCIDGPDINALLTLVKVHKARLLYLVPNFQNPSGVTISEEKRRHIAAIAEAYNLLIVEDDPYGQLRYEGEALMPIKYYHENTILCGTFSKLISPGLRIGWVVAQEEIIQKLLVFKQASDLHSNSLSQYIIAYYLRNHAFDSHLSHLKNSYSEKCNLMYNAIKLYFPKACKVKKPEGGMFLWVQLPEGINSTSLLSSVIRDNVIFVPGKYFFTNGEGEDTLRLNFSNSTEGEILGGIQIIGNAIYQLMEGEV